MRETIGSASIEGLTKKRLYRSREGLITVHKYTYISRYIAQLR